MAEPTCNFHESLSVFELDLATWKQRDTWYSNLYTVLHCTKDHLSSML